MKTSLTLSDAAARGTSLARTTRVPLTCTSRGRYTSRSTCVKALFAPPEGAPQRFRQSYNHQIYVALLDPCPLLSLQ
jgi:hypothetical protein